jgi:phospholipase/carboxylesterase
MKKIIALVLLFVAFLANGQVVNINTSLVYKVNPPSKTSGRTPIIIMLHGYGSNEEDLFDIAKSFDARFLTFSVRAPFAAEGQGYCWYKLDFLPQKQFRHDYKQAKESRAKLLSFISNACKAYKADSTQVFVLGYSQGAIMAYDIALNNPAKIKGVLALSGFIMEETKKNKVDALKVSNIRFFIAHGTADNVVDFKQGEEAAKYLQSKKNNVTFKSYEMPHAVTGKELNDIKSWLASNLEKEIKTGSKQ